MDEALTGQSVSLFNSDIFTYFWDSPVDRSTIRGQIVKSFSNELTKTEKQTILNLKLLPTSENLFFSISHCPVGGGFVAHHNPIGFDIEKTTRTQNKALINKVSSIKEQKLFDENWFLIWSLKEAAFKCLTQSKVNIKTISQILIINLEINSNFELKAYLSYNTLKIFGHCIWDKQKTYSIASMNKNILN